jgi:subtilisin family serine protease
MLSGGADVLSSSTGGKSMRAHPRTRTLLGVAAGATATALFCGALAAPAQAGPTSPSAPQPAPSAAKLKVARGAEASRVIKGQYLVETNGTPLVRGGSAVTNRHAQAAATSAVTTVGATVRDSFSDLWTGISIAATDSQIAELATSSAVKAIYPVLSVPLPRTTVSATAITEGLTSAAGSGYTGKGIKVGVIDTGVDYNNPDLGGAGTNNQKADFKKKGGRVMYGYDFVGDDYDSAGVYGSTSTHADAYPDDCAGHGTHVAGIIGANGTGTGAKVGVAPGVTFGAYRIFGCDENASTSTALILKALSKAKADGMNVVNLSLGLDFASWPSYPDAVAAASLVKAGVVVVAAAGNDGEQGLFTAGTPAVGAGVISVASDVTADDPADRTLSEFSSAGLAADLSLVPTITAPGSDIYSTWPLEKGAHQTLSGTSMATPAVAGSVALLLQAKSSLKKHPGSVAQLLYNTASPLSQAIEAGVTSNPEAVFRQGAGVVDPAAAIAAAVTASPSVIKLGEGTTHTVTVTLTNKTKQVQTYTPSAVTGVSAAASTGTGTMVGTTTPDYAFGPVSATFSASSVKIKAGKTAKVKVTLRAPSSILSGRTGMLYGGWVQFTSSGTGNKVSVPFAGLRGDYQSVSVLNKFTFTPSGESEAWTMPGLGKVEDGYAVPQTETNPTYSMDPISYDVPLMLYHLDYPVSDLRLTVKNTTTGKSYDAIINWRYVKNSKASSSSLHLNKQPRDAGYNAIDLPGAYYSKGKVKALPGGTYTMTLKALRALGSSSKASQWDTYTSPSFTIDW